MFELKGQYNSAVIYTDDCDKDTRIQIETLLNQESCEGSMIRIMPDCHAGKGCVIGTTMTLKDKVIPNLVGVDIGCGMLAVKLKEKRVEFPKLDSVINSKVPSGFDIHKKQIRDMTELSDIHADVNLERAKYSIGTLGGGNHFIEVDKDKDDCLWLVIHTGSRNLGKEICDFYQDMAYEKLKEKKAGGSLSELTHTLIDKYKSENREKELSEALQKLKDDYKNTQPEVPYELAYLKGDSFDMYIHDMEIAQAYAKLNRRTIADIIVKAMKWHIIDEFDTIHNYIDTKNMILRKGSISALAGERVIIPMNMRDGSLICTGKGNPEWNSSAPHGAGRVLSRSEAKESVPMKDFKNAMKGIYTTSVAQSTVDEAPQVYKPMGEIIENIHETVDIADTIKPVYNFKAH